MENLLIISSSDSSDSECKKKKSKIYYSKLCQHFSSSNSEAEEEYNKNLTNSGNKPIIENKDSKSSNALVISDAIFHKAKKSKKMTKINKPSLPDKSDSESSYGNSVPSSDVILNTTQSTKVVDCTDKYFFNDSDNWSIESSEFNKTHTMRHYESKIVNFCDICEKKGHPSYECTRTGPVCMTCAEEGHQSRRCPKLICTVCYSNDHLTKKCPIKKDLNKTKCERCDQLGHPDNICSDEWRQYKYTMSDTQPIIKKVPSQIKKSVYCANCTMQGHFTDQCRSQKLYGMFSDTSVMEINMFDQVNNYTDISYSKASKNTANVPVSYVKPIYKDVDITTRSNEHAMRRSESSILIDDSMTLEEKLAKLPPLKNKLLRQIFPEETSGMLTIPVLLRRKLRSKLKKFLKNGYLPGGDESVHQRMQAWLVDVTKGKETNPKTQLHILSSVSAAVHSISHHISREENNTSIVPKSISIKSEDPIKINFYQSNESIKDTDKMVGCKTSNESNVTKETEETKFNIGSINLGIGSVSNKNIKEINNNDTILIEIEDDDDFFVDATVVNEQYISNESSLANVLAREEATPVSTELAENTLNIPVDGNNKRKGSKLSRSQKRAKRKRVEKHAVNELRHLKKKPVARIQSNLSVIEIPSDIKSPVPFPKQKKKRSRTKNKSQMGSEQNPIVL